MTAGALATTASAAVLLGIARRALLVRPPRQPRRRGAVRACDVRSLALPLAARGQAVDLPPPIRQRRRAGCSSRPPRTAARRDDAARRRVARLHLPRVAEGRLPNFARLLDAGAGMDLATMRPTQPDPVWAAVATGMYPAKNGVRSARRYFARSETARSICCPTTASRTRSCISASSATSRTRRTAGGRGRSGDPRRRWRQRRHRPLAADVSRLEAVDGFIVSDRFHQLVGSIADFDRAARPPATCCRSLEAALPTRQAGVRCESDVQRRRAREPGRIRAAPRSRYSAAMHELAGEIGARLTALRYEGLDTVGHYYLRYTQPGRFRDCPTRIAAASRR